MRIAVRSRLAPGMCLVMLVLSHFTWSNHVYDAPYTRDPTLWSVSHLSDQKAGGGVMLVKSILTMLPHSSGSSYRC